MKHFLDFIREASESETTGKLVDVKLTYTLKKHDLLIQVPDTYSEEDIQIYLNDRALPDMPGSSETSENIFSTNSEFITDAYFEYDRFELESDSSEDPDIEWDPHYEEDNKSEHNHLYIYKLVNLRYSLLFSEFQVVNVDPSNIQTEFYDIIKTTESNNSNKYIFDIEIKKENIKYKNYEQTDQ